MIPPGLVLERRWGYLLITKEKCYKIPYWLDERVIGVCASVHVRESKWVDENEQ